MPDFSYVARDQMGQRITGTLVAGNQREALAALTKQSLFPITVSDKAPEKTSGAIGRVKPRVVAGMYSQLASLLRSGVPLLRSLNVIREQSSHGGLKRVMTSIHDQVEQGATLAEAMGRHPKVFGEMPISMVRAGGEGAFLEDALDRVAEFTEKQQDMKAKTTGAMVYPLFLATFGGGIVSMLLIVFVPKFAELFGKMRERGQLPYLTEVLLSVSGTLRSYWWIIIAAIFFVVMFIKMQLATEAGRLMRDRFVLRAPIIGHIYQSLAVSRFCRVLGTLLHNGVPILRALEISGGATANRILAGAVDDAASNISAGEALAKPLAASGYFPRDVVEMISVAEESNTLEKVLTNIADTLEKKTWRQLDLAVRMLEPLMLSLLGIIVLLVALGLLMPLFNMSSAL